ncbi:exosortase B [Methylotenera sp.]|uniref:exosortase B n=1 Tax=Methylotenera sp. TaxID=2051956 RepID=UPI002730ADD0|nr:exosortase B [Methylotenera sp.]MDP2231502.1 exosortase B [Methylotenera sp.]MDP3331932.1 exosortase B [Methylococcaceae bacterium]
MVTSIASLNKVLPAWVREWWPILLGLITLYVPTYYNLSMGIWGNEDQAHGPIVLMVILYLFWQNREQLQPNKEAKTWPVLGSLSLGSGLLCYVLGRSQDIIFIEIASQILVFAGILLLTRGISTLKAMWFPLFFILFMIPLPGFFLDAVSLPMKMAVSYVAENVLFWFGYPIARTGVILQIGQYQLLVADACAGMHTLISLEALGLLYLNLVKHDSLFRNITLAILIVPISFTANVIRVMVLTLVTYYYGDAAGQGFVHGFAGMVLFIVALTLIMSVDTILQYIAKHWNFGRIVSVDSKVAAPGNTHK